jgi:hypothetical protein
LIQEAARLRVSKSDLIRRYVEAGLHNEEAPGMVERATEADLATLGTRHPMAEAMGALALRLARAADYSSAGVLAGLAREFRATLAELAGREQKQDGDSLANLFGPY